MGHHVCQQNMTQASEQLLQQHNSERNENKYIINHLEHVSRVSPEYYAKQHKQQRTLRVAWHAKHKRP